MKITPFFSFAAVCALAFSFCISSYAQDRPAYATVVGLTGEARYSPDGTTWHPLVVGQVLVAGEVIETAINGSADIVLGAKVQSHFASGPATLQPAPAPDANVRGMTAFQSAAHQNVIHLGSGTVLSINKLTMGDTGVDAVSNTELDLRKGNLLANVKKLSASSQYIVKMPNAIAGIRGSSVYFDADHSGLAVLVGSCVVASVAGGTAAGTTTTVVVSGQFYNFVSGLLTSLTSTQLAVLDDILHATVTVESGFVSVVFQNDNTTVDISPKA